MRDEDFWHDFEAGRGGDGGEGIGAYQRMRLRLLQQVLLDTRHRQADRQTKDSTLSLTVNLLSLSASLSRACQVLLLRASGMVEEDTDDEEYEEYEEEEEEGVRLMQLQRGDGRGCAPSWH